MAGTIAIFALAMCHYPEVQAKAREELDRVVGDRLPCHADLEELPYFNAMLTESLRWHPPIPLRELFLGGILRDLRRWLITVAYFLLPKAVHRLTHDDVYEGKLIPAGSVAVINCW